ncbi:urea permease [Extremus antarcticus]|uniref:Urea permease n=1 Tax=Extremus antarcticus TaxID=702011 RepID=A0AAJ0GAP2_9PEZI|nr:urea permease [Extremus antarcticus]
MAAETGFKVLPSGAGYGIVIGIGGVFALLMLGITWMQNRYTRFSTKQAEEFNTASRSVKPGLIASGIVSSWTWSATLLTSSTFAYSYGVCGPMWYGAMGTFQILLFALIAIKIKANAPGAHTFPEIVLARHGKIAHITYLFNGLATNMLVGACLVLGGSQVVAALTGMNVYGACFLIPLVVAAYVIAGGLRSTFIADYIHTVVLFIAIFVFGFLMYATSDLVGSPGKLYDMLLDASEAMPIANNTEGSYLAFRSVDGLVFAIDLFAAGFSTVWLDQAYWQRAIASKPETSVKAYLLGGIAWYGIPFGFATAMGLGCAALTTNPRFPTYPNPLSAAENGAGLSSPATAITLLGQGGAVLMLVLLFMAVTSSTSAELIAVSSLLTFDVYKTYFKPDASSARLVQISHYGIILYALVLAAFCCILNAVGLNLTWLLTILAIMVGGASIPVGLILLWKRMSTAAAIGAPWIGLICGLTAWFVTTWKRSGAITVETTGDTTNAVAGNVTSWGVGFVMAVVLSLAFPARYSSTDPKHIERSHKIQGIPVQRSAVGSPVSEPSEKAGPPQEDTEKAGPPASDQPRSESMAESYVPTGNEIVDFLEAKQMEPMDPAAVKQAERLAIGANIAFGAIAIVLVPFSLFGTGYIYNRAFFTGWVVVSFIWVWVSMTICVIYPVVESTGALREISRGLWRDIAVLLGGKKGKACQAGNEA